MQKEPSLKPSSLRLYRVIDAKGGIHLVKAASRDRAILHVYTPYCRPVNGLEASDLMQQGLKVEDASGATEEQPVLDLPAPTPPAV